MRVRVRVRVKVRVGVRVRVSSFRARGVHDGHGGRLDVTPMVT